MALTLGDALFTKTQQRVLGLFFSVPGARFYTNDILRRLEMGRGTVLRELDKLAQAGILSRTREGNQNYYQANTDSPVYPELLAIVRKTFGVAEVLRGALQPIEDRLVLAFVYGSLAKGTEDKNSDIDLMLVGQDLAYSEVMNCLLPLESELMRPVNPSIYTPEELNQKRKQGNSFIERVMEQPKLWVKGSDDDMDGIG